MSDEELDSVFRRVADEYPQDAPPPDAWERLETRLTTATTAQQLRGKVLRVFGAEVATLAVLLWLGAQLLPRPASPTHMPVAALPTAEAHHASSSRAPLAATATIANNTATTATTNTAATAIATTVTTNTTAATATPATTLTATTASASPAAGQASKGRLAATTPGQLTASLASPRTSARVATGAPTRQLPDIATTAAVGGGQVRAAASPASEARKWASPIGVALPVARTAHHSQFSAEAVNEREPGLAGPARGRRASHAHRKAALVATDYSVNNQQDTYKVSAMSGGSEILAPGLAEGTAASREARLDLASYPLPAPLAGIALPPPSDSTKEPKRPVARPPYRLVLGLLGAPAFSAVRTPQTAQLGGDYGLTLEYVLTSRLRVRAGLISSQKRYRAASADYEAPAAWQWYAGDYTLDGNCRITEIPLDVRFDVLRRPTYAVFGSVGVNSLLMRDERYSYDWTMGGHTYTKSAQVINGSNHFLSVLNLSVGVERPIGGRWSAQVEPFWQIPLGGVGAGQVHLSSAGAAFSLKFGLIR